MSRVLSELRPKNPRFAGADSGRLFVVAVVSLAGVDSAATCNGVTGS